MNNKGTGYGGYASKGKSGATKLKELLASNKKLRTQLAGISVSKQSKLLKDIMAKKKITLDDLKSVKIDTKPSKSFK